MVVLFKRMVKHRSSNMVGIYTIDVSMTSAESKENSNSWMWYTLIIKVVFFSQQKLNCKLRVFCLTPKVTGQPIQYFCFALPKTFLTVFFVLYLVTIHWLIFLLK